MHVLERLACSGEQHPGAAIVDHCAQFGGRRVRIDRHCYISGAQNCEICHDELDAVRPTDRDSMARYQSVRCQSGSDRVDTSLELSPCHGAACRPWLNQPDVPRLRLRLTSHKISKVGVDGARVYRLEGCLEVVHPAESGTRDGRLDIMVMR
jgi:hypothetical protein